VTYFLQYFRVIGNRYFDRVEYTCHRYIKNLPHRPDYKDALAQGLHIGSKEIESVRRYINQQLLKLPDTWRAPHKVESMLALRIIRANNKWNEYWN
jgi:hypothetical protein